MAGFIKQELVRKLVDSESWLWWFKSAKINFL